MANLLVLQGLCEQAIPHFQSAVKLEPGNWPACNNLGGVLAKLGKLEAAARCFSDYLRLTPGNAEAHSNLGKVLALQGKPEPATAEYHEAARLEPDNPAAHHQLGLLLQQQGNRTEALRQFSAVAKLMPQEPGPHYDFGLALAKAGETEQALKEFREAVRLNPDWVPALNNLAWLLATEARPELRNGAEAVALAERACQLTSYKDARVVGTLDASYAEAGRFREAVEAAQKTCELARELGLTNVAATAQNRLAALPRRQAFS